MSRFLVVLLLLVFNELSVKVYGVAAHGYSSVRSKRSLTTICVEIKPNGPLEEPYYMCRGTEFPAFPKISGNGMASPQYSNLDGSIQPGNQQISPPYVKKDDYGNSYNNGGPTNTGTNFQNFASHYSPASGNDKNSNSQPEPIAPYNAQFSSGNTKSGGSTSSISINFKESFGNTGGVTDGFQKHPSSNSYQKPPEQHQQYYSTDYNQQFQPQPQLQPQSQHQPQHQPQQQQIIQYQQPQQQNKADPQNLQNHEQQTPYQQKNFRPSTKIENSAVEKNTGYESIKSKDSSEKPNQNSHTFPSHGTKTSPSFTKDHSAFKNIATSYPSHASNVHAAPQHRNDAAGCGDDCGKPISATVSSELYYGHNNGKSFYHNGPNFSVQQSNIGPVPARNEKITPSVQNVPFAPANAARTQPSSPLRFGAPIQSAVEPNERSMLPHVPASDVQSPQPPNERVRPFMHASSRKHLQTFPDNHQRMNILHQQLHPTAPDAHRYRAMIDDEVLQVPNWGFSTDELDIYRTMPDAEIDPNILALHPTPRTIPIEHLEDPVMRAFYNSLPDVHPLPLYKPFNTEAYNYLQPQRHNPTSYINPPVSRNPYQMPSICAPCQAQTQQYNYNSCIPTGGYNFQPLFIALPCYNPSLYQPMMPQVPIGYPNIPFAAIDQKNLGMPSPLAAPDSRTPSTPSTPSPMTQKETLPSKNPNIRKDARAETAAPTTPASTAANESVESSEETLNPKDLTKSNVSKANSSPEEDFGSQETKNAVGGNLDGSKLNLNFTEKAEQPVTTASVPTEVMGAAYSAATPSSADRIDGDLDNEAQSRTTFKSLFLNARRLAGLSNNSEDINPYALDISTPKPSPKRQRQIAKTLTNGSGNGKRKFTQ